MAIKEVTEDLFDVMKKLGEATAVLSKSVLIVAEYTILFQMRHYPISHDLLEDLRS